MTVKKLSVVLAVILLATLTANAANTIAAGTTITIRTGSTLDSGKVSSGATFDGTLVNDVRNGNTVVAKRGNSVQGRVVSAKDSGRLHKPGILRLALVSVNGIPVSTNSRSFQGKSHTKGNVTKIGVGTGAGALIGGLAGGGKGALIGAGAGAAAGTGVAYATGKEQAVVPAETTLTFTTR